MDNLTSLEYIIENDEFIEKFATALISTKAAVRKQVFQILAAICVYSKDGYRRSLQVLERYKTSRNEKYRFGFVLEELRKVNNEGHKTAVLEFINCLIVYTDDIEERIRIRNEFLGLRLQEVLNESRNASNAEMQLQIDLFEDHKNSDEESLPGVQGVDLSCPLDVFYAIQKQVTDTPYELQFLTVLQHLLKVDSSREDLCCAMWNTLEHLVHKATLLESASGAAKLLTLTSRRMDGNAFVCCQRQSSRESHPDIELCSPSCNIDRDLANTSDRQDIAGELQAHQPFVTHTNITSLDTTPTSSFSLPSDPPINSSFALAVTPPTPPAPPPPPPPLNPSGLHASVSPPTFPGLQQLGRSPEADCILPQQKIPTPRSKMRKLQWKKIPTDTIVNKSNLWTLVGKLFGDRYKVDCHKVDELFTISHTSAMQKANSLRAQTDSAESKKKENIEIILLDGKRSMNVNIFLKQFRTSHDEIVSLLREGRSDKFGAERLKGLLKQLPSKDEIDILKGFDGDKNKLGNAEKFFVCLMGLPNFRMRIEGLLMREEFSSNMDWIKPSIEAVIQTAKDIKANHSLQELIYLILITGNYLNSGNYAGNAAGFQLNSLLKLTEIRANKPRMNLLHYVVSEAEKNNPKLLHFPEEMSFLKDAAQVSMEGLQSDISGLSGKMQALTDQIKMAGEDFQRQIADFLKEGNVEVDELVEDMKDIEAYRRELAVFFCEDLDKFKLEECFNIIQTFSDRFRKAVEENKQRKILEQKSEARRRLKETECDRNMRIPSARDIQGNGEGTENSIVDLLLADVRNGFCYKTCPNGIYNTSECPKDDLEKKIIKADCLADTRKMQSRDISLHTPSVTGEKVHEHIAFVRGAYGRHSFRNKKMEIFPDTASKDFEHYSSLSHSKINDNDPMFGCSKDNYATGKKPSILDFLTEPELESKAVTPETSFSRYGSLRKRREERHNIRRLRCLDDEERERAASPAINSSGSVLSSGQTPEIRHSNNSVDGTSTIDEISPLTNPSPSDEKDLEALIVRIKSRLNGERTINSLTSSSTLEKSLIANSVNQPKASTLRRNSSVIMAAKDARVDQSRANLKKRYSTCYNHNQLNQLLSSNKIEAVDGSEVLVNVSMRKAISNKIGTNVDSLLKTIENSDRPIEKYNVVSPSVRRGGDSSSDSTDYALLNIDELRSATPSVHQNAELKERRERRKMRSTLSIDEVHVALRTLSPAVACSGQDRSSSDDLLNEFLPSESSRNAVLLEMQSNVELSPADDTISEGRHRQLMDEKSATGKRNFRDARFGYKDMRSVAERKGWCKSNVEKELVENARNNHVTQATMVRSKSFDESDVRAVELNRNAAIVSSCGNSPSFTDDRKHSLHSNNNHFSMDGRRNCLYIPRDTFDVGTSVSVALVTAPSVLNSGQSDCNSGASHLSIKSTNNSTETLRADRDSDADTLLDERYSDNYCLEGKETLGRLSGLVIGNDPTKVAVGYSNIERSSDFNHSANLVNSDTGHPTTQSILKHPEDDDNPLASVAKWRLKRHKKLNTCEKVPADGDILNGSNTKTVSEHQALSLSAAIISSNADLKHDVGSRSSYASSTDTDQGFESMGNASERTSMSSTLESEFNSSAPVMSRRSDIHQIVKKENQPPDRMKSEAAKDSRKQRTKTWTAETLKASSSNNKRAAALSAEQLTSSDSGHGTSMEEFPSETNSPDIIRDQCSFTESSTGESKQKTRLIHGYLRGKNSSLKARVSICQSPSPDNNFRREATARKSFRCKESVLKKNSTTRTPIRAVKCKNNGISLTNVNKRVTPTTNQSSDNVPAIADQDALQLTKGTSNSVESSVVSNLTDASDEKISHAKKPLRKEPATLSTPSPLSGRKAASGSRGLDRTQSLRVTSKKSSRSSTESRPSLVSQQTTIISHSIPTNSSSRVTGSSLTVLSQPSQEVPVSQNGDNKENPCAPAGRKYGFMKSTTSSRIASNRHLALTSKGHKDKKVNISLTRQSSLRQPKSAQSPVESSKAVHSTAMSSGIQGRRSGGLKSSPVNAVPLLAAVSESRGPDDAGQADSTDTLTKVVVTKTSLPVKVGVVEIKGPSTLRKKYVFGSRTRSCREKS